MMVKTVTCPQCGKLVEWVPEQQWRPFCSERCKLIDLGDWAAENHRIPDKSPPVVDIDDYNPSDYH